MISSKYLLFFVSIFIFLLLGTPAQIITLSICLVYSLLGINQALKALTISFIISFINPNLYGGSNEIVTILRMLLFMTASFSILGKTILKKDQPKSVKRLGLLIIIILFASLVSSYYLKVSLFKLFLFSTSSTAILLGFYHSSYTTNEWIKWFVSQWVIVIILSALLIAIPSIGFAVNGVGFQGIANHPQTFGVILAPILSLVVGKIFFEKEKVSLTLKLVIILCIFEIVLSQARTGLISMFVSIFFIFSLLFTTNRIWRKYFIRPFRNWQFLLLFFITIIIIPFIYTSFQDTIIGYLLKGRGEGNLSNSFYESRGFLIELQMENIKNNLFTGIGFQLATIPETFNVEIDPFFGLPIKGSIEKGNIFTAVLEESGIFGAIGLIYFLIGHFSSFVKKNVFSLLWLAMTAFFINIGEATLFSLSGIGLYIWLMMGLGLNYK